MSLGLHLCRQAGARVPAGGMNAAVPTPLPGQPRRAAAHLICPGQVFSMPLCLPRHQSRA